MDNITHSLAGWALGQAGLKTRTRKGLAVLILGANMPDIDVFFGNAPWDPLAIHRGFTHGLVGGVLLMPPVLAGLLWLLDRWQLSRGATFSSGLLMRFRWLIGPRLPRSADASLARLVDDLFGPVVLACFQRLVSRRCAVHRRCLAVAIASHRDWRLEAARAQRARVAARAQVAIGITLAYIGLNLLISDRATAAVRRWSDGQPVEAIFASPPPLVFWRRDLVWREGDCYRRSLFDPLDGGFHAVSRCSPTNMGDPIVRKAIRRNPRLRKFLKWSILPQADVTREACNVRVAIGDARYGEGRRSRLARESVMPVGGPGC